LNLSVNFWDVSSNGPLPIADKEKMNSRYIVWPQFGSCLVENLGLFNHDLAGYFNRAFDRSGVVAYSSGDKPGLILLDCQLEDVESLVFDYSEPIASKSGRDFSGLLLPRSRDKKIAQKAQKFASSEASADLGFVFQPKVFKNLQRKALRC